MSGELDKDGLIKYLKSHRLEDTSMIWLKWPNSLDCDSNTMEYLHDNVSGVEFLLNESKLTVKEFTYLYHLTLPRFPEGLWFLFSVIHHPEIDSHAYVKKLWDSNFSCLYWNGDLPIYRRIIVGMWV